jgi:hypothetical protein
MEVTKMNPKNALFLAATLTAFVLATLFAVVNKVTTTPIEAAAAPAVQNTATTIAQPTDQSTATAQSQLGPEEAAKLAADAISRTDVYSVESFSYKGVDTFKVVFSSGDIVYVGMDRQVVDTAKLQAVAVYSAPVVPATKKHNGGGGGTKTTAPAATQPPSTTPPGDGGREPGDN